MVIEHSGMKVTTDGIKSKLLNMEVEASFRSSALASKAFSKPFHARNPNGGSSVKYDNMSM